MSTFTCRGGGRQKRKRSCSVWSYSCS